MRCHKQPTGRRELHSLLNREPHQKEERGIAESDLMVCADLGVVLEACIITWTSQFNRYSLFETSFHKGVFNIFANILNYDLNLLKKLCEPHRTKLKTMSIVYRV